MEHYERLRAARVAAGFSRASEAARALGVPGPTYLGHENGSRDFRRDNSMVELYARRFSVSPEWLAFERGNAPDGMPAIAAPQQATHVLQAEAGRYDLRGGEARILGPSRELSGEGKRIPVYGQAIGGPDGRFVLNGNNLFDVLAPASLSGVSTAYAVMVVGDSMEPRYHSGEVAYVHPGLPVRRGDYVVAQIVEDEHEPPSAYVKQFVSLTENGLTLEQLNPKRSLKFSRPTVKSVHRIILAGEP